MKIFGNLIVHVFSNTVAILAGAYFITGFIFTGDFLTLIFTAGILTIINLVIRPVLKLFLGPLVVLTFGLFLVVINAATLYILDIVSTPLIIEGYLPLLIATVLFSVVNTIITISAKSAYRG